MNKKIILLIIIFTLTLFTISISFAFIIRETTAKNIITFGSLKMKLIVSSKEDGNERNISDGEKLNVTFNKMINRNISIKNVCNHPMFVRVAFNLVGETYENIIIENFSDITFEQLDNDWIYKDGWFYYKETLNKNEITNKLIMNFKFNIDEILNKYNESMYELKIRAEALQAENNNKYVLDAVGWPSNS